MYIIAVLCCVRSNDLLSFYRACFICDILPLFSTSGCLPAFLPSLPVTVCVRRCQRTAQTQTVERSCANLVVITAHVPGTIRISLHARAAQSLWLTFCWRRYKNLWWKSKTTKSVWAKKQARCSPCCCRIHRPARHELMLRCSFLPIM